ncbi:MAG: hypothetical protein WC547_06660, partial [Candidatus Omnitrophota bacterium]
FMENFVYDVTVEQGELEVPGTGGMGRMIIDGTVYGITHPSAAPAVAVAQPVANTTINKTLDRNISAQDLTAWNILAWNATALSANRTANLTADLAVANGQFSSVPAENIANFTRGGTIAQQSNTTLLRSHGSDFGTLDFAFTFDEALWDTLFIQNGQVDRGVANAEFYRAVWANATARGIPFNGYASAYNVNDGTVAESLYRPGPNAFQAARALAEYNMTHNETALAEATALVHHAAKSQVDGVIPQSIGYASTEENFDWHPVFKDYVAITGDKTIAQADAQLQDYLKSQYNNETKVFNRGSYVERDASGAIVLKPDTGFATDVQPIAVVSMGAEGLGAWGIDASELMNTTERMGVGTYNYTKPDGMNVTVTLASFGDKSMGSAEWTGWLALGFKTAGNSARADYYMGELENMSYKGTLPYATKENADTGHGFPTPYGKYSLSSGALYIFAKTGDNPLTMKNEGAAFDLAGLEKTQGTLTQSDYPVILKGLTFPTAAKELYDAQVAREAVNKSLSDTSYGPYLQNELVKAQAYQGVLMDSDGIVAQYSKAGKGNEWGAWVEASLPVELDQVDTRMEYMGTVDSMQVYKYITSKSKATLYYGIRTDEQYPANVYFWLASSKIGQLYIDALQDEWGGWLPLTPGISLPNDNAIAITENGTSYIWQPSITDNNKVRAAMADYGFVSLDTTKLTGRETLQIWTPAEIAKNNWTVAIDPVYSYKGNLTIDGTTMPVVFSAGEKAIQEHIDALEGTNNPFGGFVTGMDNKKVWVSSINATLQLPLIAKTLPDSQNGTITKEIQYFVPEQTAQGTQFVPFGSVETNTYKDGLMIKQDKDGFETVFFYDEKSQAFLAGSPISSATYIANTSLISSDSVTKNIDLANGTIEKKENFYGGSKDLVLKTQDNIYDLKGRLLESKEDNQITINHYAGQYSEYGIADSAETFVINNDGTRELYISSKLISYVNGKALVQLTNHLTKTTWQELHNGLGRIAENYYGNVDKNGTFVRTSIEKRYYEGVAGLFNTASSSTTWVADEQGNATGAPISTSFLLDNHGNKADTEKAVPSDIFDKQGNVRYQGVEYYYGNSGELVGTQYFQQTKDKQGIVLENDFGVIQNDKFVPQTKIYSFYNPNSELGKFDINDVTITTVIIDGIEYIFSYSNYTFIDESGNIHYNIKQGSAPFEGPINYTTLRTALDNSTVKFDHISKSWQEVKNGRGQLMISNDFLTPINETTGFVEKDAKPTYITFLSYPEKGDIRFATEAYTYKYISGKENYSDYAHSDWIARNTNFRIENGLVIYDMANKRIDKQSMIQEALRLDGRLYYEMHKGSEGYEQVKIYFDERQAPAYSVKVKDSLGTPLPAEQPYEDFIVLYKGLSEYYVYPISVESGITGDFNRIPYKNDQYVMPTRMALKYDAYINGNLYFRSDNHQIVYMNEEMLPWYGPRNREGFNRLSNTMLVKHGRVVLEEDVPTIAAWIHGDLYNSEETEIGKDKLVVGTIGNSAWWLAISAAFAIVTFTGIYWLIKKIKIAWDKTHEPELNDWTKSKELYEYAFKKGFVSFEDGKEVKLFDESLEKAVETQIEEDIAQKKLPPMAKDSRSYFWEKYYRMVYIIYKPYIEQVLRDLGFTRKSVVPEFDDSLLRSLVAKGIVEVDGNSVIWLSNTEDELVKELAQYQEFDQQTIEKLVKIFENIKTYELTKLISFIRKDKYIWNRDVDVFEYVTAYILDMLVDRLSNGYEPQYQEAGIDLSVMTGVVSKGTRQGIYIKVERPRRWEKKGVDKEWQGYVEVPLYQAIEDLVRKFLTGSLANNAAYGEYLRARSRELREQGRVKEILPETLMTSAFFGKLMALMLNVHQSRVTRG